MGRLPKSKSLNVESPKIETVRRADIDIRDNGFIYKFRNATAVKDLDVSGLSTTVIPKAFDFYKRTPNTRIEVQVLYCDFYPKLSVNEEGFSEESLKENWSIYTSIFIDDLASLKEDKLIDYFNKLNPSLSMQTIKADSLGKIMKYLDIDNGYHLNVVDPYDKERQLDHVDLLMSVLENEDELLTKLLRGYSKKISSKNFNINTVTKL